LLAFFLFGQPYESLHVITAYFHDHAVDSLLPGAGTAKGDIIRVLAFNFIVNMMNQVVKK
jgi:hypothetical protein